jgi:hypothetical protein
LGLLTLVEQCFRSIFRDDVMRKLLWLVVAACLTQAAAQQRSTGLQWSGQRLSAGHFNVHKFHVFTAAESLEVVLKAQSIETFSGLNVWLRHGSPPTPEQHHVHAVLHGRGRGRGGDVGLHVKNPLEGDWYVAVAPEAAGVVAETPAMEVTDHQFIQEPGSATYSIDATAAGCDRGRFGFPSCDSNWMELSWGKEAQFHGELGAGKDVWTCRCDGCSTPMYRIIEFPPLSLLATEFSSLSLPARRVP